MFSVKLRHTLLFLGKKYVPGLFLTLFLNPILFSVHWATAVVSLYMLQTESKHLPFYVGMDDIPCNVVVSCLLS